MKIMLRLHDWWDRVSGAELERAKAEWKTATLRTHRAQLKLCSRTGRMRDVEAAGRALDALEKAMRNGEAQ